MCVCDVCVHMFVLSVGCTVQLLAKRCDWLALGCKTYSSGPKRKPRQMYVPPWNMRTGCISSPCTANGGSTSMLRSFRLAITFQCSLVTNLASACGWCSTAPETQKSMKVGFEGWGGLETHRHTDTDRQTSRQADR